MSKFCASVEPVWLLCVSLFKFSILMHGFLSCLLEFQLHDDDINGTGYANSSWAHNLTDMELSDLLFFSFGLHYDFTDIVLNWIVPILALLLSRLVCSAFVMPACSRRVFFVNRNLWTGNFRNYLRFNKSDNHEIAGKRTESDNNNNSQQNSWKSKLRYH
jgi:hypothetical protein